MPELVQSALSALRHLQPTDRVTAITILSLWAHAAEIDVERVVNYYFTGGQPDVEPAVIAVADGHVVHPCCGKVDDDPHRDFCAYYRDQSPTEQFLDETAARWSFEDRQRARVDSRDGRDERLIGNTDFRDGYVEGYLDAIKAARDIRSERKRVVLECPEWCTVDHTEDDARDDVVLHQGADHTDGIVRKLLDPHQLDMRVTRADMPDEGVVGVPSLYVRAELELTTWEQAAELSRSILDSFGYLEVGAL